MVRNIIIPLFLITYYFETVGTVFYCKVKLKQAGSDTVQEYNCVYSKEVGLADILEDIHGEPVKLVKVKDINAI